MQHPPATHCPCFWTVAPPVSLSLRIGSPALPARLLIHPSLRQVDSVFFTPAGKKEEAANARRVFEHGDGDHFTYLKVRARTHGHRHTPTTHASSVRIWAPSFPRPSLRIPRNHASSPSLHSPSSCCRISSTFFILRPLTKCCEHHSLDPCAFRQPSYTCFFLGLRAWVRG